MAIVILFFLLSLSASIISHDTSDVGSKRTNESLLISLSALKLATDDFSEANKLGEGGFGSVYKVPHLLLINFLFYIFVFMTASKVV